MNVDEQVVDERRDHRDERLRHHHVALQLPVAQAERPRRLELAARQRLQPAAHRLGHVGGLEQDEPDRDAPERIDAPAGRQHQRKHEGGDEQHGDERHAAHELDVGVASERSNGICERRASASSTPIGAERRSRTASG